MHEREPVPRIAEAAETLDVEAGVGPETTISPAGQPWPKCGHYQPIRQLGQGGMGRVALAYDTRLQRNVAIKFVRGDDPDLMRRLLVEARAQARIDHPHVCKVYEVGEVAGRAYIVMQYIAGEPLSELIGTLRFEQMAAVMQAVAEGAHAAHRIGLIHRDIKPANIMVTRDRAGRLEPYLMDFGITRDPEVGHTATGSVLGTPGYMAPEQAQGMVAGLDRRADVYSLGATLYRLMCEVMPIPGRTPVEMLANLLTVEPRPPRLIRPDIPADLEAIALTCLEKKRANRYPSARAVADELGRYLAGDPVLARKADIWYRLGRRVRKHWLAVVTIAVGLSIATVSLASAWSAQRQADERIGWARTFTETVERLEASVRYTALSPLHDTRAATAALEAGIGALTRQVITAGPHARGPGAYALGRAYWALGDIDAAQRQLEAAWNGGYRQPRVAHALALVLGRRYQNALLASQNLSSPQRRERARAVAVKEYRDPARVLLEHGRAGGAPTEGYLGALWAFYDGQLEPALKRAQKAAADQPWLYEAPLLTGDIWLLRGLEDWHRGAPSEARAAYQQARVAYQRAADIAPSVPAVHTALAQLEFESLRIALYNQGDPAPAFERGLAAVERALFVAARDADSHVMRSRLYRRLAEFRMRSGGDVSAALAAAVTSAEIAVGEAPASADARMTHMRACRQAARDALDHSRDPSAALSCALQSLDAVGEADRGYEYYIDRGLLFTVWADHDERRGRDPHARRSQAIASLQRAVALDPEHATAWMSLGNEHYKRATRAAPSAAVDDLEQAAEALRQAKRQNPEHIAPHFYAGRVSMLSARYDHLGRAAGADADGPVGDRHRLAAISHYRAGIAINSRIPQLQNGLGLALLAQAEAIWARGGDPEPLAAEARAVIEQALAIAPEQAFGHNNLGEVYRYRARWQRAAGRDPTDSGERAAAAYREALARMPGRAPILANLAATQLIRADWALSQADRRWFEQHAGRTAAWLAEADSLLARALTQDPGHAASVRWQAQRFALQAELTLRTASATERARATPEADPSPPGRSAQAGRDLSQHVAANFAAAQAAFERAIELAPARLDYQIDFAALLLRWAAWPGSAPAERAERLARSQELIDTVLRYDPELIAAQTLRARLRQQRAGAAASATTPR